MFKRIELDNFLSFDHLVIDLVGKGKAPLNHAVVYGENGSGKTNLMESVVFLKESVNTMVLNDLMSSFTRNLSEGPGISEGGDPLPGLLDALRREMVRLNSRNLDITVFSRPRHMIGSTGPTRVRFIMQISDVPYEYELCFDSDGSLSKEELRTVLSERMGRLFSIVTGDKGPDMVFNESLFLESDYRDEIRDAVRKYWGKHTLLAIFNREYASKNLGYMETVLRKAVFDVLGAICTTVTNVPSPSGAPMLTHGLGIDLIRGSMPSGQRGILTAYESALSKFFSRLYSDIVSVSYSTSEVGGMIVYELFFNKRVAGLVRAIPCMNESAGTKALVSLFPSLMGCAEGRTAFIDEMGSGIHDKLVFDLMQQILPDLKGQLVITTHNTSLLEFLPPSNVFILDVDAEGYKSILPVSAIGRTQRNNNNRIRYLHGQFNGVPIIGYIDLAGIASSFHRDLGAI